MREIKFRIYIKEHKDFYYFWIEDLINLSPSSQLAEDIKTNERQQFTGLLDKNWVEIYEGDVLKYKLHDYNWFWRWQTNIPKIWVVRYEPENSWYICEWEYSQHQHHEYIYESEYSCEIIWNIYSEKNKNTLHTLLNTGSTDTV